MARALPPEHPAEAKHLEPIGGVVFYRMLRPEFLQILKSLKMPPLSADALSNWGTGAGSQMHNRNIRMATRFLTTSVIPQLAVDIKEKKDAFQQSISSFVHKAGVNIRSSSPYIFAIAIISYQSIYVLVSYLIRHLGYLRYLLRHEADIQQVGQK